MSAHSPSRETLLAEYNQLVDNVENASSEQLFELGNWLDENTDSEQGRRTDLGTIAPKLTLRDCAKERGFSERWLREIRRVAKVTRGNRLPGVKLTVYRDVLRKHAWDIEATNLEIQGRIQKGEPVVDPRERPAGTPRVDQRRAEPPATDEHGGDENGDGDGVVTHEFLRARLRRVADVIAAEVEVIRSLMARMPDDEATDSDEPDVADKPEGADDPDADS
jgi:hypothetical protein